MTHRPPGSRHEQLDNAQRTLVYGLLDAYAHGWFPMGDVPAGASENAHPGEIRWFSPDPRGILPLEPGGFRVSSSLAQRVRSGRFDVRTNTDFAAVIRACAGPRTSRDADADDGTWIDRRIIHAYELLHRAGHAHSVEAWLPRPDGSAVLVGGLYGVHLGAAFFGESMFSRPDLGGTDASKVCLVHLVAHLRSRGFVLLDTQFYTEHLGRFGAIQISRDDYLQRLSTALAAHADWPPFTPGPRDADVGDRAER